MSELYTYNRVKFNKGEQSRFLKEAKTKLKLSCKEMANLFHISTRTFTDWQREKFTMPVEAVTLLSQRLGKPLPSFSTMPQFWYTTKGGHAGGIAVYQKYGRVGGDPERRKEKWRIWWEREGKFKPSGILNSPLPFFKPELSADLAEFIGIMMGDGGVSRYQICITLHHKDDLAYSKFVARLAEKVFGIAPSIYHDIKSSVNNIVISRSGLVKYLNSLGLPVGNKIRQGLDIPKWIKENREYSIACLRGLVDTDGCIFTHTYRVKGKQYAYKKLAFSNRSKPLLLSVCFLLKSIGLQPRLTPGIDVRLDSAKDMKRYFEKVNSHNPKHLRRYKQ